MERMEQPTEGVFDPSKIKRIPAINKVPTSLSFNGRTFDIHYQDQEIRISLNEENYVKLSLVNQQVSYKATILGGYAVSEEKTGKVDYQKYFYVDWEDDLSIPEMNFAVPPRAITRQYLKGQWIELGLEKVVSMYRVKYKDGVEAEFVRKDAKGFSFSFSTGFYGSFRREEDGSYTLRFKGDRLKPGEDDFRSQSKFIVSRSKYTDKLLLILQDDAEVTLG